MNKGMVVNVRHEKLTDEEVYFKFMKDLLKIRDVLGKEGAVENAAQEICDFVGV